MIRNTITRTIRRLTAYNLQLHNQANGTQYSFSPSSFHSSRPTVHTLFSRRTDATYITGNFTPPPAPKTRTRKEERKLAHLQADADKALWEGYWDLHYPNWRNEERLAGSALQAMSWNCQGLASASSSLALTLQNRSLDVIMLQELSTKYPKDWVPIPLSGYQFYRDCRSKTGFYVKESVQHWPVPIKLTVNPRVPEDTIYATGVIVRATYAQKVQNILFLNIYRSPNGEQDDFSALDDYMRQCKDYAQRTLRIKIDGHLISGDFNASHELWGAKHHSPGSKKYGERLVTYLLGSRYRLLNDGSPTRYMFKRHEHRLHHSWLDVTFASELVKDCTNWRVHQLDQCSDHYQIYMDLHGCSVSHMNTDHGPEEKRWALSDDPRKWKRFREMLQERWELVRDDIVSLGNHECTPTNSELLSSAVIKCFHYAANFAFGKCTTTKRWKSWIGRGAQKASLQYKQAYRAYLKKKHRTKHDYRKLCALRAKRNKMMKHHKAHYLARKFAHHQLDSREGWKIAAEVRDLNEHRGRRLPDLIDPDTNEVIATTLKEKAELMNAHYHRFDDIASHPPSWCWRSGAVLTSPTYSGETSEQRYRELPRVSMPALQKMRPFHQTCTGSARGKAAELHKRFTKMVEINTRNRWERAQPDHREYLGLLNSRISRPEIRRAISSFKSGKSAGSDMLEVSFIKNGGSTVVDIFEEIYNIFFLKWHHIPLQFKERWITPIIKAGKTGNIPKELRPVSLTSYVAKLWEKIMVYRLSSYVIRLRLLSRCHFAYLSGRSTTDAMVYLVDRLQRSLNSKQDAHCIFFDMTSAFDTVRVAQLTWKLEHEYFITGNFLLTLTDFLQDRRGCVKLDGLLSEWQPDIIGVPQGGGLSPLIFLIYLDQLSIVESIHGVKISIFSDDLTVFTTPTAAAAPHDALQEALLFVQWYTDQHGVIINHSKTAYKIFSKHKADNARRSAPIPLYLSGALKDLLLRRTGRDTTVPSADIFLALVTKAVRYLGFWLDDQLTFNEHVDKLCAAVDAAYYTIARNMRTLWHIRADIIWNLLNACVLSHYDYSAVLWLQFSAPAKGRLIRRYNRVIHRAFNATKGTNLIHEQLQCYTLPLKERMLSQCSQYFTRLLRTPCSGVMYSEVNDYWWLLIQAWSAGGAAPPLRRMGIKHSFIREDGTLAINCNLQNTLIWRLIKNAHENGNDDLLHCAAIDSFAEIPHQVSYILDLSKPWIHNGLEESPFTDEWSMAQLSMTPQQNDILAFTDGSCEGRTGGFGTHIITQQQYHTVLGRARDEHIAYADSLRESDCFVPDVSQPISKRCSIDFAEALAIRNALESIVHTLHDAAAAQGTYAPAPAPVNLGIIPVLNVTGVRLISDSQVVLRWIAGIYRIRNPRMNEIIKDIHWLIRTLEAENPGLRVTYQWTKSHDKGPDGPRTNGNCQADYCAGSAKDALLRDRRGRLGCRDLWGYYNQRAALHQDLQPFFEQQQAKLSASVLNTVYGTVLHSKLLRDTTHDQRRTGNVAEGYKWNRYHYHELSRFSRDEIRILLALRTGHNHFKHYISLLNPRVQARCECGRSYHHLEHVMRDCADARVIELRQLMIREGMKLMLSDHQSQQAKDKELSLPCVDPRDPLMYLFPLSVESTTADGLKKLIINFYRSCMGYQKRYPIH